jgi:transcriptional regulator with XRE-family HTH domain
VHLGAVRRPNRARSGAACRERPSASCRRSSCPRIVRAVASEHGPRGSARPPTAHPGVHRGSRSGAVPALRPEDRSDRVAVRKPCHGSVGSRPRHSGRSGEGHRKTRRGMPALPFCHVHLRAKRTDPRLPRELKTLGDHIRKKRIELGLLQREVADLLGADPQSVNAWERNYRQPVLHRLPAIAAFLGYDLEPPPADAPLGLRIASRRRRLGLSQKALAERLGIDEATVRKWERARIFLRVDERVQRILDGWVNSAG